MHEKALLMDFRSDKISLLSRWLPVVIWMSVILCFSSDDFSKDDTSVIITPVLKFVLGPTASDDQLDLGHWIVRKSAHLFEYAVLAGLWYRGINKGFKTWSIRAAALSIIFSAAYACSDELRQSFTFSREGRMEDVFIDSFGAFISMGVVWFYNRRRSSGE